MIKPNTIVVTTISQILLTSTTPGVAEVIDIMELPIDTPSGNDKIDTT